MIFLPLQTILVKMDISEKQKKKNLQNFEDDLSLFSLDYKKKNTAKIVLRYFGKTYCVLMENISFLIRFRYSRRGFSEVKETSEPSDTFWKDI